MMMQHLININDLNANQIAEIFAQADTLSTAKNTHKLLKHITLANMFFENSTRTLVSFELAAKKLGANVINVNIAKSSTQKGETLKDTLQTLQAMGIDGFVIRHSENHICEKIVPWLNNNSHLINAGDGNHQHPTQALLDCYTILQHKKNIAAIKVAIIGDILHSRVANSLIDCLSILGNKNMHLYGPKALLPTLCNQATICANLQQALKAADVIVMLRIQKERLAANTTVEMNNYHQNYGLNRENLRHAKADCMVMHPGPINREVEISSELADNPPSVILQQVKNGVLIRQALLIKLFQAG